MANKGPAAAGRGTPGPKNKRVKRETSPPPAVKPKEEADAENVEGDDGPSAYELQRLAKIKENARMMASLGLSGAKGEMRTAVSSDAALRAKARGLGPPRQPKSYPARSRCVLKCTQALNLCVVQALLYKHASVHVFRV